jgi:hypothetical protein
VIPDVPLKLFVIAHEQWCHQLTRNPPVNVCFLITDERCRVCDVVPVGMGGLGILCSFMLVGAAEGARSEVIAWFASDKTSFSAQCSAYQTRAQIEAGSGGLQSSFFVLWATSLLLCSKA